MKKLLSLLFVLVLGIHAYAQAKKSYVYMCMKTVDQYSSAWLSGNVPEDIGAVYDRWYQTYRLEGTTGEILNKLAEKGFVVEQMTNSEYNTYMNYLLSKEVSDTYTAIPKKSTNQDVLVHEVARYNLQGMPVNESEKGVQIVVYSNYTTKTVIKE